MPDQPKAEQIIRPLIFMRFLPESYTIGLMWNLNLSVFCLDALNYEKVDWIVLWILGWVKQYSFITLHCTEDYAVRFLRCKYNAIQCCNILIVFQSHNMVKEKAGETTMWFVILRSKPGR